MITLRKTLTILIGTFAILSTGGSKAQALQTISWSGYTWTISPYAIGSGIVSGNTSNVWIDASGYLHLDISNIGGKWYGAEVDGVSNLGFGHYYWVFNAPVTTMEHQDVLAGFTYGPQNGIGKSGQNEIDIEFSHWNNASWWNPANNGDFDVYPSSTGHAKGNVEYDWAYGGTNTCTCRIDWSSTTVTESVWNGIVSPTASTSTAAVTWTYNGTKSTIPQPACPMCFNLWAYGQAPTQPVDAVIETFQYSP